MTIRLLLVDDQSIIRRGLSAVLAVEPGLEVVGEADHGESAIALVNTLNPDVVLMDMRMPVMDGVAATRILSQQENAPKILVLTTFDDTDAAAQALQAGAAGYLLKDTPIEELVQAIQLVHRGYNQLAPGLIQRLLEKSVEPLEATTSPEFTGLTPREQEILRWIGRGASNREIAQQLYISERTVRNHVTSILSQLGLRDRTQAAIFFNSHDRQQ
jgi:DNA-binding NarL/FixJ family response regulator